MSSVPSPPVDDLFDEPADEPLPDGFDESDRDFWLAWLRDLHGYDEDVLVERPNRWIWNTALDVMDA